VLINLDDNQYYATETVTNLEELPEIDMQAEGLMPYVLVSRHNGGPVTYDADYFGKFIRLKWYYFGYDRLNGDVSF
jgi:hypothetical protein